MENQNQISDTINLYYLNHKLTEKDILRFLSKCDIKEDQEDECWNWLGYKDRGYGKFSIRGSMAISSRLAYIIYNQVNIELEDVIAHVCDNPSCVNPSHLFKTTKAGNNLDKANKDRAKGLTRKRLHAGQIREIYKLLDQGFTQSELAREYGVAQAYLNHIANGYYWPRLFKIWKEDKKGEIL